MLHTNDDFLRAIEADPRERTLRLAYADWLAEHDDPRGELVRVEEEMRALPVFADRFWSLKPRRNELRAAAGEGWCGRMRYGTDCLPVFEHGIPGGWRERWRLIREFTERWHRVPMPDVGGRRKEVAEAEARLGRTLPPSVREWIAFALDRNDRQYEPGPLHVFRDHYELEDLTDCGALSLLCQCEGDYRWAIDHAALASEDPPVRGYHVSYDPETHLPDDRYPSGRGLTEFTLGLALAYAGGDCANAVDHALADAGPARRELEGMFPPPVRLGDCDLYEIENVVVSVGPRSWGPGTWFRMTVFKPLPHEQLPASLWEYSSAGSFFRRFGRLPPPDPEFLPPTPMSYLEMPVDGPDGDIPF